MIAGAAPVVSSPLAVAPVLGALCLVASNLPFIITTWRGQTRPNIVTWALWPLLGWTGVAAQFAVAPGLTAVLLVVAVTLSSAVFVGAVWQRSRVGRRSSGAAPATAEPLPAWQAWIDLICGLGAIMALLLVLVSAGHVALGLTIGCDALAAIPTLAHAWRAPDEESPLPYLGGSVAGLLTMISVPEWTFDQIGYAFYFLVIGLMITATIHLGRRRNRPRPVAPGERGLRSAASALDRIPAAPTVHGRPILDPRLDPQTMPIRLPDTDALVRQAWRAGYDAVQAERHATAPKAVAPPMEGAAMAAVTRPGPPKAPGSRRATHPAAGGDRFDPIDPDPR